MHKHDDESSLNCPKRNNRIRKKKKTIKTETGRNWIRAIVLENCRNEQNLKLGTLFTQFVNIDWFIIIFCVT